MSASSRVTSFGALAPGISTAPITTSAANTSSSIDFEGREAGANAPVKEFIELAQPGIDGRGW